MMNKIELYNQSAQATDRAAKKRALLFMLLIGAAGLIPCIILCTLATRQNMSLLLPLTIGIATLFGWIVITILHGSFAKANARGKHDRMMLNEARDTVAGSFRKTDDVRRMRSGMAVRKVLAYADEHERVLSINEDKAAQLPDVFSGTVETVYDFIVAFEVNGDA